MHILFFLLFVTGLLQSCANSGYHPHYIISQDECDTCPKDKKR